MNFLITQEEAPERLRDLLIFDIIRGTCGSRIATPPLAGRKVQTVESRGRSVSSDPDTLKSYRGWCPADERRRGRFPNRRDERATETSFFLKPKGNGRRVKRCNPTYGNLRIGRKNGCFPEILNQIGTRPEVESTPLSGAVR